MTQTSGLSLYMYLFCRTQKWNSTNAYAISGICTQCDIFAIACVHVCTVEIFQLPQLRRGGGLSSVSSLRHICNTCIAWSVVARVDNIPSFEVDYALKTASSVTVWPIFTQAASPNAAKLEVTASTLFTQAVSLVRARVRPIRTHGTSAG